MLKQQGTSTTTAMNSLIMLANQQADQVENEFRNIKLKLRGPNRHSELQAVKALMAMSAQQNVFHARHETTTDLVTTTTTVSSNTITAIAKPPKDHTQGLVSQSLSNSSSSSSKPKKRPPPRQPPQQLPRQPSANSEGRRSDSPEPIYGLSITMTEEEFRLLAEREGIEDVIGEPVCRLCGGLFSGPLGIALHMCPAMKRQTFRCDICGEDKWKTKANLHSHIKWCKKRYNTKTEQHESKQINY